MIQPEIYASGYFRDSVDFDPGSGTYNLVSNGDHDIFISKLDPSGNLLWAKSMGGSNSDDGYSIALDGTGHVYTTGFFKDTVDFDPGSGVFNLISQGFHDMYISKFDIDGNFVWAKRIGGSDPYLSYTYGFSITLDAYGGIYTTGVFNNTVDFDPDTTQYNLTTNGGHIFILKLSQDTSIEANFTASDTTVLYGDTIYFTDFSIGNPTNWLWDFGDGNTDTTQNPIHVYTTPGVYTVSLVVSDNSGNDSPVLQNYITVYSLPLIISYNQSDIQCYGDSTGFIDFSIAGINPPYTYNWSNGDTTQDVSNLSAGWYYTTVSDNNGNSLTDSVLISQAAQIQISSNITDIPCYGINTGEIQITISNGMYPLQYLWNTGDSASNLLNQPAGKYYLTVIDSTN